MLESLKNTIRDVPDFPKEGIIFKDITTLLQNGKLFKKAVDAMAGKFIDKKIDIVAGIESRGFIFGAAIAYKLGVGFVPIRKKGKLPHKTVSAEYALEYGVDSVEIHEDAVKEGQKVLLVDDLLATGGTIGASAELIEELKGDIVGICLLIELTFLEGIKKLEKYDVASLIKY
ncbi:MAG: adenine phosphoribosyltransferase [Candidatus Aureabacteria bacterium]|nr:adenine phosphoribosyltransferase [Candidatus Auribacterota bacterium]